MERVVRIPQNNYLDVWGINTRYWTAGDGPPLLLLHGLAGFVEHWLLNIEPLAAHYRVYALDMLGHGRTDGLDAGSYSLSVFADFVKGFMEALDLARVYVVAHSFGGAVALQLALDAPESIARLVLADSAGLGRQCSRSVRLFAAPGIGEVLARRAYPDDIDRYREMHKTFVVNPDLWGEEVVRSFFDTRSTVYRHKAPLRVLRSIVNVSGQRKDVYEPLVAGLPRIEQETLVIWGEDDPTVPVAHAHVAADGLPHATLEIMPGCGHGPAVEAPAAFNDLVLGFLN